VEPGVSIAEAARNLGDVEQARSNWVNAHRIGGAEPNQNGMILNADVLLDFLVLLPAYPDHRSENADAVHTLLDLAGKLIPRINASNAGCVWLLPCDFEDVSKRVVVKAALSLSFSRS
jgi:hypothetical protein